jgi:hypothetical protein
MGSRVYPEGQKISAVGTAGSKETEARTGLGHLDSKEQLVRTLSASHLNPFQIKHLESFHYLLHQVNFIVKWAS